jgi:hypothetical protein
MIARAQQIRAIRANFALRTPQAVHSR